MRRVRRRIAGIGAAMALTGGAATLSGTAYANDRHPLDRHVLLLSVDGLHQSDLDAYVGAHPHSSLARLVGHGTEFTGASTPVPSDSFPGLVAQVTGGNPKTTGVYYNDTWNTGLLPAGTTDCTHTTPGAEVAYAENLDRDPASLDAGGGLNGLPASILVLTGNARDLIDPAQLPVDPTACAPVYPHQYLRVNTVFEMAKAAGLRTAWSDKHPAYEILNGPSGTGIDDLFTPEINADAPTTGTGADWTTDNRLTQQYDGYKVQAVLDEIAGLDHSGSATVGVPAIFGMNFQSVSTAEKLPTSGGQPGGYLADGTTPGPVLASALDFVDRAIGQMQAALAAQHLDHSTTIILSAKHGQSPHDGASLTRIPDGPIFDALNAAWKAVGHDRDLVAFSIDDDAMILWLTDHSETATTFAADFLLAHDGSGNDLAGDPKPYIASGIAAVHAGADAARFFDAHSGDGRVPDLYGEVQHGVVYTSGTKKIAEHGGTDPEDRHVPLVVASGSGGHRRVDHPVETTQIAPTILRLLGLDPGRLQAVRAEHTSALPVGP